MLSNPTSRFGDTGITTTIYDTIVSHHLYGRLLVYNARQKETWLLENKQAADDYFARFDPAKTAGCEFEDGGGVSVY